MTTIYDNCFQGGRIFANSKNYRFENCVFFNGESALKDCQNIVLNSCIFEWKYPLWYCKNIELANTTILETGRSGIWYTDDIRIHDSVIEAPKVFRYSKKIVLDKVFLPNAKETCWNCQEIILKDVAINGDYFGMNSSNMEINRINLTGNYCFDSCNNVNIQKSILISKDAFWNCSNVTVYNSTIIGEHLGWNSNNLTFVNCLISSFQGLSRINGLTMKSCRLIKTGMAFELCSKIDAHVLSDIGSVFNPTSGTIQAQHINDIRLDGENVERHNLFIHTKEEGD